MVKVSIIVPIFNVEQYLGCCLESLTNQTLSEIEIICVNDNTPDRSMDICYQYATKDDRIKVIDKKVNEGLGLTRNSGIEIATGEYIAFVDSDDYVALDMYEKLYMEAKRKQLDACYCGYATDVNGTLIFKNGSPQYNCEYIGKEKARNFLLEMIGPEPEFPSDVKFMISAWDCIYSRKILKEYNVRFLCERKILSEDTLFNVDFLLCSENVGFIPDQLYRYRYNPTSLSRTFNHDKAEKFIVLLNVLEEKLKQNFRQEDYLLHYNRFVFYIFRLLIKYEAVVNIEGNRRQSIRRWCKHSLITKVINEYPYYRMDLKRKLFFFSMKHQLITPLIWISIIENKIKKNI